jgi:hypothetical protein
MCKHVLWSYGNQKLPSDKSRRFLLCGRERREVTKEGGKELSVFILAFLRAHEECV